MFKYFVWWIQAQYCKEGHDAVREGPQPGASPVVWYPTASWPNAGWNEETCASLGLTNTDQEMAKIFIGSYGEDGNLPWDSPLGQFVSLVGDILYDIGHHPEGYRTAHRIEISKPLTLPACREYIAAHRPYAA